MWAMDGRGCGAAGPLVPTLAGIASRVSPRPQLHSGSPSGAGSTAIQRKATQRAQVSPTLTRPGALTPPPQRGRYKEGSWSPPPFLGLLSSFAPKSSHSFSLHFFSFWVFLNYPPSFFVSLCCLCVPPPSPHSQFLCPFGPPCSHTLVPSFLGLLFDMPNQFWVECI
ncbi:hypothetical protein ACRRTK_009524 [Alexandromys fortis]